MSYTIHQQPVTYQPAYNESIFVVSSSNNTQDNFNYFADLYINSDVIRIKSSAHPTYGSGVFDFGRIIESYVNSDIDKSTYGIQLNVNSYASYYVKFGEEYGVSSGVIQYPNITTTAVKYVWNGVLDFFQMQTYVQDTWTMEGSGAFLTSFTGERNNLDADYSWLYWVADGSSPSSLSHINIKTFDSAGSVIKNVGITNPYSSSGVIGNHFARVTTGKPQLNLISAGSLMYGAQPIIPSNAVSYEVTFQDASSGVISNTVTYNIVEEDCLYDNYRLHFLNKLGGFDSFNFSKKSVKETEIIRSKYKAKVGALTSATAYGYSKSDSGERSYFISSSDTIKLQSDWLTDAEYIWLRELIESAEVYIDDSTYGLISVTITDSRFITRTSLNDKNKNLEINIKYSHNRYSQRY